MGQKVNPIGFRLGVHRDWLASWYSSVHYADLLHQDMALRAFILGVLHRKEFLIGDILISRTASNIVITIQYVVDDVYQDIPDKLRVHIVNKLTKFLHTQVSVRFTKCTNIYQTAIFVARHIVRLLEARVSYKEAFRRVLSKSKGYDFISGIKLRCAGRLGGEEMARAEWVKDGRLPLQSISKNIDYGMSTAHTQYGCCGVKVWLCVSSAVPSISE